MNHISPRIMRDLKHQKTMDHNNVNKLPIVSLIETRARLDQVGWNCPSFFESLYISALSVPGWTFLCSADHGVFIVPWVFSSTTYHRNLAFVDPVASRNLPQKARAELVIILLSSVFCRSLKSILFEQNFSLSWVTRYLHSQRRAQQAGKEGNGGCIKCFTLESEVS